VFLTMGTCGLISKLGKSAREVQGVKRDPVTGATCKLILTLNKLIVTWRLNLQVALQPPGHLSFLFLHKQANDNPEVEPSGYSATSGSLELFVSAQTSK
jgi:hypothetical protein